MISKNCSSVFERVRIRFWRSLWILCVCCIFVPVTLTLAFLPEAAQKTVWQHLQRHNSLTNCCILRLSAVMPLHKSQKPLCSSINWTEMNQKKIRTSPWPWHPSATIISSAVSSHVLTYVKFIKFDFHPYISNAAQLYCYKQTVTTSNVNVKNVFPNVCFVIHIGTYVFYVILFYVSKAALNCLNTCSLSGVTLVCHDLTTSFVLNLYISCLHGLIWILSLIILMCW